MGNADVLVTPTWPEAWAGGWPGLTPEPCVSSLLAPGCGQLPRDLPAAQLMSGVGWPGRCWNRRALVPGALHAVRPVLDGVWK